MPRRLCLQAWQGFHKASSRYAALNILGRRLALQGGLHLGLLTSLALMLAEAGAAVGKVRQSNLLRAREAGTGVLATHL